MIPSQKVPSDFPFAHSGQPDDYGVSVGDFPTVQANFDSRAIFNQDQINDIIEALTSTTAGDSGAHNVGSAPITGVSGTTVQAKLIALKALIDDLVLGEIPDNSITVDKLTEDAIGALTHYVDETTGVTQKLVLDNGTWYTEEV